MGASRQVGAKVGSALVMAAVFALGASPAEAAFKLALNDLSNPGVEFIITDNGVGDLNPLAGAIVFAGSLPDFLVSVTTGLSKPIQTAAVGSNPAMDLNSVNVSTTGPAALNIYLTDTAWSGPATESFTMNVGGTLNSGAGSSLTYSAFSGAGEFSLTNLIGSLGFGPGAFSGTTGGSVPAGAAYSLTQVVSIVLTRNGAVSFDAELVPEPASLALLGIGLLGLGVVARRRRQQKNVA